MTLLSNLGNFQLSRTRHWFMNEALCPLKVLPIGWESSRNRARNRF